VNAFLNHPAVQALGWALLHFVWQGTLLAALFLVADSVTRRSQARLRYAIACAVMFLMAVSFIATVFRTSRAPASGVSSAMATGAANPGQRTLRTRIEPASVPLATSSTGKIAQPFYALTVLPGWIAFFWLLGVIAFATYTAAGWLRVRELRKRDIAPVSAAWIEVLEILKHRLQISRPVRLCTSAIAEVPAVIGWLRPYILLPVSVFTGLSESELRAILAHELAHIRRCDYLVNLLQNAIETLLFYHPAVWWVSHRIRQERENCCDDVAVEICGGVTIYANALAQLEELRGSISEPAVAATGGDLLARIRRLTGVNETAQPRIPVSAGSILIAFLAIAALAVTGHAPSIHAQSPAPHKVQTPPPIATLSAAPVQVAQASPPQTPAKTPATHPAPAATPKFDVVSIRLCKDFNGGPGRGSGGGTPAATPGRLRMNCRSVQSLIGQAYRNDRSSPRGTPIEGGPAWIDADLYTIEAEAEGAPDLSTMQGEMLQALLEDRFRLKIHRETRDVPAYALTVARGGPKLQPFQDGECTQHVAGAPRPGPDEKPWCGTGGMRTVRNGPNLTWDVRGMSFLNFSVFFGIVLDRPVIDKTGITGVFDFHLEFAPDETTAGPASPFGPIAAPQTTPSDPAGGPSIFTAFQNQLGLKLESSKAPAEFLIIDRVERPSEN
jgi:uncharacterized protein (TIGR03435 family)